MVPSNNDSVRCVITSTLNCVTENPASSAKIIMIGSFAPNVSFPACFDTVTLVNANSSSLVQYDNCISEKYCYNNLAVNCNQYGGLYQWDELMNYTDTPLGQGICPPGWHVPSESDWTILFNDYQGNSRAGRPLQDTIINRFKALRSGVFYLQNSMSYLGFATLFWSSTTSGQQRALAHGMND